MKPVNTGNDEITNKVYKLIKTSLILRQIKVEHNTQNLGIPYFESIMFNVFPFVDCYR